MNMELKMLQIDADYIMQIGNLDLASVGTNRIHAASE